MLIYIIHPLVIVIFEFIVHKINMEKYYINLRPIIIFFISYVISYIYYKIKEIAK